MTIVSPGAASCGGGAARSTLLVSPKKRELKTYQSRRSLDGCPCASAIQSMRQEEAANRERPDGPRQEPEVIVVDVALPPPRVQEPAKLKRGGDSGVEISWSAKKKRSAIARASSESGRAILAAAASSMVQELDGIWVGPNPETICKKDQSSSGGGAGAFMVETKDEKLRPCTLAAPGPALADARPDQSGEEVCWRTKKKCPDTEVSMAGPSTPPLPILDPVPLREAKAAARQCRKTTKHYDCKTTQQPFMSLSSRLQCLGVTNVTTVLAKVLTPTDCNVNQSRLQLSVSFVVDSPLMLMFTPCEHRAVHREGNWDGLPLEALDRHGGSYDTTFKFLKSVGAYRLIGGWGKFLTQNGVCSGDRFELGAFRFEGQLVLTLMHHAMEDQTHEEIEAAEISEAVQICKEMEENENAVEGTSGEIEAAEGAEKWTCEEMEAVAIMMELADLKVGERP